MTEHAYGVSHACDWADAPFGELDEARLVGALHLMACGGHRSLLPRTIDPVACGLTFWEITDAEVKAIGGVREGEIWSRPEMERVDNAST